MYRTKNPDIFCCPDRGASSFGKGLCGQLRLLGLATARTLVMVVGPGFGRTSGLKVLAVYWPLYVICNEKWIMVERAWDGINLRPTIRRRELHVDVGGVMSDS